MKASQLRRLSLLLVVSLMAVAAMRAPLTARAQDDSETEDAEMEIDLDAPEVLDEEMDEKDVVVLTEENFNDVVLTARFALVRLITVIAAVILHCAGDDSL